jgi:hypothetical protein
MLSVVIRSRWSGLFNGNWVRCRKGVFKGFVKRLLLVLPRALGENTAISLTRFTFWIGIHFHLSPFVRCTHFLRDLLTNTRDPDMLPSGPGSSPVECDPINRRT